MNASLYERLGGSEGIGRIVDDILSAHLENPIVRARFQNIKDMDHAKQMARDFFCAGCGGPQIYKGKEMREAHRGMNISEREYMSVMDDILAALGKNGVDEQTRNEVLAILYGMKGEIIRV